ncbi:MAG: hypothetical protein DRP42_00960 [Tenericutes bacterium]|nr:MAG: hypothetical protein DRP42_00960 [Mycoplasmatota bacterium]
MQELINNGFVLSVKYTDEYDARVKILLDNGNIVNLNALGLQKPNAKNAAALQPFNLIEVEFFQSENAT